MIDIVERLRKHPTRIFRALLDEAATEIERLRRAVPSPDVAVRGALEEAQKAVKLLEELCACCSDDEYVWGIQAKIEAALAQTKITAVLASRPAMAVPDGWKLVPIEPTEEMLHAADAHESFAPDDYERYTETYRAMLSASPSPGIGESEK